MEAIRTAFEEGVRSFEILTTPTETRGRRVTASFGGEENFPFENFSNENFPIENFSNEDFEDENNDSEETDENNDSEETDQVDDNNDSNDTNQISIMSRWNNTARDVEAAAAKRVIITRDKRSSLKDKELLEMKEKCVTGLDKKFAYISAQVEDEGTLQDSYDLTILVQSVLKRGVEYDTAQAFNIFTKPLPKTPDGKLDIDFTKLPTEENCLSSTQIYTEEQVKDMVRFKRLYGSETDLQDLDWMELLLENSCENNLKEKCIERMMTIDPIERGALTYFHIMHGLIQQNTQECVRSLVNRVKNLKIRDIKGENIHTLGSMIRGVHRRLSSVGAVPDDMISTVTNIMCTSSVPKFNDIFTSMKTMQTLGIVCLTGQSIESILTVAETQYLEMFSTGEWLVTGPTAFVGEGLTCWNCGDSGHVTRNCPKPVDHNAIRKNRPGGDKPPGNGTRFDRTKPPGQGEPTVRTIEGKTLKWCSVCRRWNLTHETSEHKKGKGRKSNENPPTAAHVGAIAETPQIPPQPAGFPGIPTSPMAATALTEEAKEAQKQSWLSYASQVAKFANGF